MEYSSRIFVKRRNFIDNVILPIIHELDEEDGLASTPFDYEKIYCSIGEFMSEYMEELIIHNWHSCLASMQEGK